MRVESLGLRGVRRVSPIAGSAAIDTGSLSVTTGMRPGEMGIVRP